MVRNFFGHDKEKSLRFLEPKGFTLVNPVDPKHPNPWCFLRFKEYTVAKSDLLWGPFTGEDPELAKPAEGYNQAMAELLKSIKSLDDFRARLGSRAELMAKEQMFVEDSHWQFVHRQVVGDAVGLVIDPVAMMHQSPAMTTVKPSPSGDVEMLFDLGEQNVGYYSFDLVADAGVGDRRVEHRVHHARRPVAAYGQLSQRHTLHHQGGRQPLHVAHASFRPVRVPHPPQPEIAGENPQFPARGVNLPGELRGAVQLQRRPASTGSGTFPPAR